MIHVVVDLDDNWISFLDSGVGMDSDQVACAFAPHVSFKTASTVGGKPVKRQHLHRGYKGIGMTFLAYSTDDIRLHSKKGGIVTKARMRYGNSWAIGNRNEPALLVEDSDSSPLDSLSQGTYVRVQFSQRTRPKSLRHLAASIDVWDVILRTRTAVGQILLTSSEDVDEIEVDLTLRIGGQEDTHRISPSFLYPHEVVRLPPFRFLDLDDYYARHPEQSAPPSQFQRQDGVFLHWDKDRIVRELTEDQRTTYKTQLEQYKPTSYGFIPYQASVWGELNRVATQHKNRTHLDSGLLIAVNRQRLADVFDIDPSRFVTFSKNVLAIVHYHGAKPDHGRKTIDTESTQLAQRIGDRMVQYLARQRSFLRPPGEEDVPKLRQVERDHEDWKHNVRNHSESNPLDIPPIRYRSTPLTEQDVVGLFHQMCAIGVFPGARVYATSQSKTYDCLMDFDCATDLPGLSYDPEKSPLGLSPFVLGDTSTFGTHYLTVEFKNNLDGLIADLDGESPKQFDKVDICVCWSSVDSTFERYELEVLREENVDGRKYPGTTHLLHRDGVQKPMAVIMLKSVIQLMESGRMILPAE